MYLDAINSNANDHDDCKRVSSYFGSNAKSLDSFIEHSQNPYLFYYR